MKRRHSLKLISALPLLAAIPSVALAEKSKKSAKKKSGGLEMLSEDDGLGKALQYKAEAKESPRRSNKKEFCYNCSKYNKCTEGDDKCKPLDDKALKSAEAAPCSLFKGKLVAKNGWCVSWEEKS